MAFTNVMRRAASRAIPSAIRGIGSQRCYHHQGLFSTAAPINTSATLSQNLSRCSFSTVIQRIHARKRNLAEQQPSTTRRQSDDALLKVLNSELHCAQESNDNNKIEDVPENFPFKIIDEPGKQTLTLTRDDYGESITVEVQIPEPPADKLDDNEDGEGITVENDDERDSNDESDDADIVLPMVVKVSKNDGPCLEFVVSAYLDEIEIETLTIQDPAIGDDGTAYEGPDFGDLDENLKKEFHKYLDNRGINSSSTKFLYEYMMNKESKEYEEWLRKAKTILEA